MKKRCELREDELDGLYDSINEKLDQLGLESQPEVAARLLSLCSEPDAGLHDFAKVIRTDPALTGRVLRMANSAYYVQLEPVSSTDRACVLIGLNRLKAISLGFYLGRAAANEEHELSRQIWGQSVYRACLASELAAMLEPRYAADAFVAALMLDSGIPLLLKMFESQFREILDKRYSPARQFKAEFDALPYTHVDVVVAMCRRWKFPDILLKPIERHHTRPHEPRDNDPADTLERIMYYVGTVGLSSERKPADTAPLPTLAQRYLGIDEHQLAGAFERASRQYDVVWEVFRGVADSIGDVSALAEEVHNRLVTELDDAMIQMMKQESRDEPVKVTLGGGIIELLRDDDHFLRAILLDHDGRPLTSHRFRAGSESADTLVESLGLDPQEYPQLAELATALDRLAA